jgi:hypothetical protein
MRSCCFLLIVFTNARIIGGITFDGVPLKHVNEPAAERRSGSGLAVSSCEFTTAEVDS